MEKGEHPSLKSWGQHEGHGFKERGKIIFADPAGEGKLMWHKKWLWVDNFGNCPGFLDLWLPPQLKDYPLEYSGPKGNPDSAAWLELHARGYFIGKSPRPAQRAVDSHLSIPHHKPRRANTGKTALAVGLYLALIFARVFRPLRPRR